MIRKTPIKAQCYDIKFNVTVLICIMLFGIKFIQPINSQSREEIFKLMEDKTLFHSYINDRVYWKDKYYQCEISPLSTFVNYEKIYPDCPKSDVEEGQTSRIDDKNYQPFWIIEDSVLYLSDIRPICLSADSFKMRHLQIEKLTGLKFKKSIFVPDSELKIFVRNRGVKGNEHGVLKAQWFTGVLYIKRDLDSDIDKDLAEYYKAPFYKLNFKKGRLITSELVTKK